MPITITIQGTPIEFPISSDSPNWADAVQQFAEAVEAALATVAGTFDIAPQVFNIDAYNPGTDVDIPNLAFSTAQVRGAIITYTAYRDTSTTSGAEVGTISVVYNPDGSTGNKWAISQERTGDASISFAITDAGQVQFTTASLGGINHVGHISFSARALEQDT